MDQQRTQHQVVRPAEVVEVLQVLEEAPEAEEVPLQAEQADSAQVEAAALPELDQTVLSDHLVVSPEALLPMVAVVAVDLSQVQQHQLALHLEDLVVVGPVVFPKIHHRTD